ncbi:uncharacterized protein [Triticum aestivum]|uniref:uncharacterized protein n=1 Tax=Triticum aestivum TaxID=4565 RepID=UPI001D01147E|nr:uncharacterized protein LOC123058671 [Triticum aestivum]
MFMLMRRAVDLKINDLLIYTDCSHCDRVVREVEIVQPKDKHAELSVAVLGLKAKFDNVFCQLEPREKLLFPDSLISLWRNSSSPHANIFEGLLGIWSPHLLGLPVFRIHQTRKAANAFIAKKNAGGSLGNLVLHHAYKVNVKEESRKMDAVRNVVMAMRPKSIEVLVRTENEAQAVGEELSKLFKQMLVKYEKRAVGEGYEVAARKGIVISGRERKLRIIYHSSMEDVTTIKAANTLSVKLLSLEDDDENITALRPECFLFFN